MCIRDSDLTVPHPRMLERSFVLIPLNEIAADVIEPQSQQSIQSFVEADDSVKKFKD